MFENPNRKERAFLEAAKNAEYNQQLLNFIPHFNKLNQDDKDEIYFEAYNNACQYNNIVGLKTLLLVEPFKIEPCLRLLFSSIYFTVKGGATQALDYLMREHSWGALEDKKNHQCLGVVHFLCTDNEPFSSIALHHLIDNYITPHNGSEANFLERQNYDDFRYAWHNENYELLYFFIEKFKLTGREEHFKNSFFGLFQGSAAEAKIFELFEINHNKKLLETQVFHTMDMLNSGLSPQTSLTLGSQDNKAPDTLASVAPALRKKPRKI